MRHHEIEKVSVAGVDEIECQLARVNSGSVDHEPELMELARDLSVMELLDDMRFESHNGNSHDARDVAAGVQATFEILGLTWPEPPTRDEIKAWLVKNDYEPADWEY